MRLRTAAGRTRSDLSSGVCISPRRFTKAYSRRVAVVLLADDDFGALEALAVAIEGAGHRVLRAGDGVDALRIATRHPIDIVVCDDHMPGMSGAALIESLRAHARLSAIPPILLVKPVDVAALLAAIENR